MDELWRVMDLIKLIKQLRDVTKFQNHSTDDRKYKMNIGGSPDE